MICFLSFIMMLGTVGALENDTISFKDAIICLLYTSDAADEL